MLCESQVYDTKNFTLVSNLDSTVYVCIDKKELIG